MKYLHLSLAVCLFTLFSSLSGQVSAGAAVEDLVIPTEVSEPPYEIGDLVMEQGYYIQRGEDDARINFRIVENKLRLYWIDANGLIAEPEFQSATVRFVGSVRGRAYHRLELLPEGSGLGAPGIMVPPHLYNVILVFPAGEGEEPITHSFRYTPLLDHAVDPTAEADS